MKTIETWAQLHDVKAVVWTALKPGFNLDSKFKSDVDVKKKRGDVPKLEEIIQHIQNLPDEDRLKAEEYVRKAPLQIRTNYRTAIEKEFGWTPIDHR